MRSEDLNKQSRVRTSEPSFAFLRPPIKNKQHTQ